MTRFPSGTPYLGPTANYDEQIDTNEFLRRVVYGRPKPLLGHMQRQDHSFFGRLLDALSNAHAVLVKVCAAESTARHTATALRKELPADLFAVAVRYSADDGDWEVVAYNQVRRELRRRAVRFTEGGQEWLPTSEVARVLGVTQSHAIRVVHESGIRQRREGGRNRILIRQIDLPILANRPGRWKRRKKTA